MKSTLFTFCSFSLLAASAQAAGGFTCQAGPNQKGNALSYCVYDPVDGAPSGGWPTIISLPGSGARGPASNAKTLAGYDAVGKLIAQYLSGNKDASRTMAATKFLTIVPIAPEGSRHFDPDNVLNILNEVKSNYKVDADRVYVTGFSMGSRGSFRFGTAHPEVLAAIAPSAGGSEKPGDGTLSQEPAEATFPELKNMMNIPLRQFAGSSDSTAGTDSPKATQQELERLGAKNAELIIMNTDHMGLSTKPWTDTDLLSWFLKQSRSGSSTVDDSSTAAPTPVEPSTTGKTSSKPSSAVPSTVNDEEEDCEEEPETSTGSTDGDDESCEEDDTTTSGSTANASDEEDCVEEVDTASGTSNTSASDEEDCEEDDTTTTSGYSTSDYGSSSSGSTTVKTSAKHVVQDTGSESNDSYPANGKLKPSSKARRGWTAPAHSRQHHRSQHKRIASTQKKRAVHFGKEIKYIRK